MKNMNYRTETPRHAHFVYSNQTSQDVAFGLTDAKGRALGARLNYSELDTTPDDEGTEWLGTDRFGHFYCVYACQTRDGKVFGAGTSTQWFDTPAERDAYIAKYLKGAEQRARKIAKAAR